MSDLDIAAIITAAGGVITAVGATFSGRSGRRDIKTRVDGIEGEDGKGGVLAGLRDDLDALAEKFRRYREAQRTAPPGSVIATGSFPAVSAEALRLDDLEQRLKAAEDRANRNETRLDKLDAWLDDARVVIVRIETHMEHLLGRRDGRDGSKR